MTPARLKAPELLVLEQWDSSLEPIPVGHEVGVEDSDQASSRGLKTEVQSSGFISFSFGATDAFNIYALVLIVFDELVDKLHRVIRRIIQHLYLQLVYWIIHIRH